MRRAQRKTFHRALKTREGSLHFSQVQRKAHQDNFSKRQISHILEKMGAMWRTDAVKQGGKGSGELDVSCDIEGV